MTIRILTPRLLKPLLCVAILSTLHGCGGGGGGGGSSTPNSPGGTPTPTPGAPAQPSAPAAPAATLSIGLKKLQFKWAAVDGATLYRVFEKVDDAGGYKQIGGDLSAGQTAFTKDIAVHTHQWATAGYQIQACNTVGCSTSNTITIANRVAEAIGYFKASNTAASDVYGWTLALSGDGNTLAVGAPGEDSNAIGDQDNNSAVDSGAVYVYSRDSAGGWTQSSYLKASNTYAGANFGDAVALSDDGNTLVVGAPFENSSTKNNPNNHSAAGAGAVYVFSRSSASASWSPPVYLKANTVTANAYFGWSVTISADGKTLAAGAMGDTLNAGAAYVFSNSNGSWSAQAAYLKATNAEADDNFGAAVKLSANGNILAVGAPFEDGATATTTPVNNSAADAGAAYIFSRNTTTLTWSQQAYLKASNVGAGDNFGSALAMDSAGTTLAVSAPYESSVLNDPASNAATDAGAVYVFTFSGSWSQQALVKASNAATNDDFGSAVALSSDGNTLVVGAIGESSAATGVNGNQADNSKDGVGAAYLFQRAGNGWAQQAYLKPSTTTNANIPTLAIGNEFGSSVAISNDTNTLAISGSFERSKATGIGGEQADITNTDAGAVWLF